MTDPIQDGNAGGNPEFEEGRYLYCVVRAAGDDSFSAEGIDGTPVSLLVEDGLGAVVQPVESVYDSDDMTRVRRWLLTHQDVVDAAGERFGTPLPFRFDTIFKGGDEVVAEWLREHRRSIAEALDYLAGRWEYRIEVRWDEAAVSERLRAEDERLQELAEGIEDASSGTGYLLESQYEQRLGERLRRRGEEVESELIESIEPFTAEIGRSDGSAGVLQGDTGSELDTVCKLSVLADEDHEEAIGERLERIAARPQFEVQYTGPWPPYTHAPEIGGEEEA